MKKQITQHSSSEKNAIISLVLGILSGGLFGLMILIAELTARYIQVPPVGLLEMFGSFLAILVFLFIPLLGIIGLILGIFGLKSAKRNFAIAGIILCSIGLLVPLYYFFK